MSTSLPPEYFDFVSKMLTVDTAARPTTEEIMTHPFVCRSRARAKEDGLPQPPKPDSWETMMQDELDVSLHSLRKHNSFNSYLKFQTAASVLIAAKLSSSELLRLISLLNGGVGSSKLRVCKVSFVCGCLAEVGHVGLLGSLAHNNDYHDYDFDLRTLRKLSRSHNEVRDREARGS